MRLAISTISYFEERFMPRFIQHYQDKVDEILVLSSTVPWQGLPIERPDKTPNIARSLGATVVEYDWKTEEEQRNAGQEFLMDYDWILHFDPDEFIDEENWKKLYEYLQTADEPAHVVEGQHTIWKNGYVAEPAADYKMLIATKPWVRFVDKRVVNTHFTIAPVWLWHFSWARTDEEVWEKISHYAHAKDFDIEAWYRDVWLKWQPGDKDVHPTSPETLHELIKVKLPAELEKLELLP